VTTTSKPTQAAVIVAGLAERLGASVVARVVGLTEGAVRSHAAGSAVPRGGARKRYCEVYDIPIEGWETPAGLAVTPPPQAPREPPSALETAKVAVAAPSAAPGAPVDARDEVLYLLRVARRQLEAAEADPEVSYPARSQLITSATGLCRLLARLSGQLEVTETAIVRSAPWARAMKIVREVLGRHPVAAAELDAALEKFTNGGES
jgi:hypothetical protein